MTTAISKIDGVIRDIWDCEKVHELREQGWFRDSKDIGLIMSTDGGALFKRTGIQIWPVWGMIANLAPTER